MGFFVTKVGAFTTLLHIYTVLHMFRHLLFWAGNQCNHQNLDPSLLLTQETLNDFHGDEANIF